MKVVCEVCEGKGEILNNNYELKKCVDCDGEGSHELEDLIELTLAIKWVQRKTQNIFIGEFGEIAYRHYNDVVKAYKEK